MKLNRSLGVSTKIQELIIDNRLSVFNTVFPKKILLNKTAKNSRDRVYSMMNTLFTMTLTATMKDKTFKNSVNIHYILHQKDRDIQKKHIEEKIKKEKINDKNNMIIKRGRPKLYKKTLPKSKENNISLNTAAYSKARKRVPLELAQELFNHSRIQNVKNNYSHWHNYRVFLGDGTYVQMQDTPELRDKYAVKYNGEETQGYPQGLLETITERGTGQIFEYKLSSRHTGELELFYDMIDQLPKQSILLLDDLYNNYETFAKLENQNVKIIVPAKRKRNYTVIEKIYEGDEIIEIKKPKKRPDWLPENAIQLPESITLRKIECISPEGKKYIVYTSVLNKSITKEEIINLYFTRWDIEISIREIKTIMDINILRSKSEEMIRKELLIALAAYNLIRQIIYDSIQNMPFFPEESFFYKFYTLNKNIYIDKKGRVYQRWSTGRKRTSGVNKK